MGPRSITLQEALAMRTITVQGYAELHYDTELQEERADPKAC